MNGHEGSCGTPTTAKRNWIGRVVLMRRPLLSLWPFLACTMLASPEDLLLSDESVPWETIGEDFLERPAPVNEAIEDLIFKSNRERKEIIAKQNLTGQDLDPPERKTIFGRSPFLGSGEIDPGFELPTGAVWQPTVILYGTYRTALQTYSNGSRDVTEWANRFDLFSNIYLTPTERILIGLRPLDRNAQFAGYRFSSPRGGQGGLDANINTLFFEGDFGELFPNLDPHDEKSLDYGFAVGRMPLNFQDGIMINDFVDAIGITRSSMFLGGASASRLTALVAWNQIHRGNNVEDKGANLYGLFYAADYAKSTYEVDLAYVEGSNSIGGDGLYFGVGQTRRFGKLNSTLRANVSWALENQTPAVDNGLLLFSQVSRTMNYNYDIAYLNTFWGVGDYTSAARDPAAGGSIGGISGLLFEAVGLGGYGSALTNQSNDAVAMALGYQHFLEGQFSKNQISAEIGGRFATDKNSRSGAGIALRYQHALGQHSILRLDGFAGSYDDGTAGGGLRAEWSYQF